MFLRSIVSGINARGKGTGTKLEVLSRDKSRAHNSLLKLLASVCKVSHKICKMCFVFDQTNID